MPTEMRLDYDKRLMLVSGRANPELAAKIASKLGVELAEVTPKTFSNGEVYCRYRGVGPRRRRVHRAADLRQPRRPG